jgi:outer membrane protein TolC
MEIKRTFRKCFGTLLPALFLLCGFHTAGQELLGIEEAIKTGLEKNYAVLIAKNDAAITEKQNNLGNAGMSPQVSLNGGYNMATVNSHQEFNTGVVQDRPGANSNNLAASVNVSWVIFDGLKMFAIKKRLDLTEELGTLQLKQQMEQTVYEIILAYYDIVRIHALIKAAKQNLEVYEERSKVAQLKMTIGSDSKVDLLLSQSDENEAKSALMQLELQLLTAKASLNTLLIRPVDTDFSPKDSIVISYKPAMDDLKKSSQNNTSFLISQKNEFITEQTIKEARSANLPFVQLNGAYNFTRAQSQAGIVFLNQQRGLNAGVTASWLLFNGNKNKKLAEERQLRLLSQKYNTSWLQQQVDGIVYINYQSFLTNQRILDLETQNMQDSKDLLTISLERYKIGKSDLLTTILTQQTVEEAQTRYINALYNTKKAETELLKANGQLIK